MLFRSKKYASRARINAARVVSPHLRIRSGIRLAGDRSKTERPPGAGGALDSTDPPYETGEPLQVNLASCALSLAASEAGSGAYGSLLPPEPSVC